MPETNLTRLALAAILLFAPATAAAESDAEKLRRVQSEIEDAEARSQAWDREALELAEETKSLRRRLVGLTARVLEKEAAVEEAEANLAALEERESAAEALFEARSEALVETVAALQILQKNPPPALLVKPDDALEAARASILLAELAPALKEQADELAFKLTELRLIRGAVEDQRTTLMRADRELAAERKGLEKTLAKRQKSWVAASKKAGQERGRLAGLAQTASTLEQLLSSLSAIVPVFPRQKPDAKGFADPGATAESAVVSRPDGKGRRGGRRLATSEGLEIALMSKARGHLRSPALGRVVSEYNRSDGSGGRTKGVQIATQPRAQVVAPFDGEIVFAGSYLSYGQLLIIEAGEGYHLLLSGMSRIDGVVGQRLLAGEPVGLMGEASSSDVVGQERSQKARDAAKPHLYFEMRKNGKPFDPVPWLARRSQRARG